MRFAERLTISAGFLKHPKRFLRFNSASFVWGLNMIVSRQLLVGMFIGILIGVAIFYGFTELTSLSSNIVAKDKEISNLQNQVSQLQSENSQLNTNITALLYQIQQLGLGANFTKYEKVQFISAYATGTPGNYQVIMQLKNTGTQTATLDPTAVFINGVPIGTASTGSASFNPTQLAPGASTTSATISLIDTATIKYTSGMSVEVMIQTTSGSQYPKVIVLP